MSEPVNTGSDTNLDVAQKSLTDALRTGFFLLRASMVVLIIAWLCSGVFKLNSSEMAARIRFGKWVTDDTGAPRIYTESRWHFALPFPFERVVRVPSTSREISLREDFWFKESSDEDDQMPLAEKARRHASLNPLIDGALLTGDGGVMHVQLKGSYNIDSNRLDAYMRRVGELSQADALVAMAVRQAAITIAASEDIDTLLAGNLSELEKVRFEAQQILTEGMQTGIVLESVSIERNMIAGAAFNAYNATGQAHARASQVRADAISLATEYMQMAAGEASQVLVELLEAIEYANLIGDEEVEALLREEMSNNLVAGRTYGVNIQQQIQAWLVQADDATRERLIQSIANIDVRTGPVASGEVSRLMSDAIGSSQRTVTQADAWMARFYATQTAWDANPAWVEADLLARARQLILTKPTTEIHYLPLSETTLNLTPDDEAHAAATDARRELAVERNEARANEGGQR